MKVVILLPTYNEKGNIERIIPLLEEKVFPKIKGHKMHILVADDTSPDGTGNIVKKFMGKWNNIELLLGKKMGLGAATLRGFTYAFEKMSADVVIDMDADLSHDPTKITEFLKKIDEGFDVVVATRYSMGGSIPKDWGVHRKFLSFFGNIFIQTVFMIWTVHDWTGSYRAIRKEVFFKEKPYLSSFSGNTLLIAFLHRAFRDGFKVTEVPIVFVDRTMGKSKIIPTAYMNDAMRYVLRERIKELFGQRTLARDMLKQRV